MLRERLRAARDHTTPGRPPGRQLTNPVCVRKERAREHPWTLGQILNSLVAAWLHLEHFSKHPEPYWDLFPNMPQDTLRRLPHTFALLMRKAGVVPNIRFNM